MARTDEIGLFWEDMPSVRNGGERQIILAPIPDTGWKAPTEFPNLRHVKAIAVDTETKDVNLKKTGPWWGRKDGHLVGVSLATEDAAWYFPMRHEVCAEENMNPDHVLSFLRDSLENDKPKLGQNLFYDIGGLWQEGVKIRGPWWDVGYAEALLEEDNLLSLDAMLHRYLGEEKQMTLLDRWLGDTYGNTKKDKRENIYRAPPSLVGPYAEQDVRPLFRLLRKQMPRLKRENLTDLYRMECKLIELFVKMRMKGVRVDIDAAERAKIQLNDIEKKLNDRITDIAGFRVNTGSSGDLARLFKTEGIPYGLTPKGAPSFTATFLDSVEHPVADLIRGARKVNKLAGTFVDSYILKGHVDGIVHGSFNSMRGERGGTRSGRLSSSNPNLQNIPSRESELESLDGLLISPLIRGIFVPHEGCRWWRKYDYSQIEYRFLAHFAVGGEADTVRQTYCANPKMDYHDAVYDRVCPYMGWDPKDKATRKIRRKPIKNINFGLLYGMGVPKLSRSLGLSPSEAKALFEGYHKAAPFVAATMEKYSNQALQRGYVETILGRRSRFDLWEPAGYGMKDESTPALPLHEAIMRYGRVKRAYAHKAINRVLQGSAAELMKKAMHDCYVAGLFDDDAAGLPDLTVHDELDFSDPNTTQSDEAFREIQHIMETAIELNVPVLADFEIGPNWGDVFEPYPLAA